MGAVFKKTVTRPLPEGAELFTKQGLQYARWKPSRGRVRTARVTTGKDGSPRILDESRTYTAKFRDGEGIVAKSQQDAGMRWRRGPFLASWSGGQNWSWRRSLRRLRTESRISRTCRS